MRFTKIVAAIERAYLAERLRAQTETGVLRSLTYATIAAVLLMNVASCSLVTLKSPEKPLSTRDLNARILTHEFSARLSPPSHRAPTTLPPALRIPPCNSIAFAGRSPRRARASMRRARSHP